MTARDRVNYPSLHLRIYGEEVDYIRKLQIIDHSEGTAAFTAPEEARLVHRSANAGNAAAGRSSSVCAINLSTVSNTAGNFRARRSISLSNSWVVSTRVGIGSEFLADFSQRLPGWAGPSRFYVFHAAANALQNFIVGWILIQPSSRTEASSAADNFGLGMSPNVVSVTQWRQLRQSVGQPAARRASVSSQLRTPEVASAASMLQAAAAQAMRAQSRGPRPRSSAASRPA